MIMLPACHMTQSLRIWYGSVRLDVLYDTVMYDTLTFGMLTIGYVDRTRTGML